MDIGPAVTLVSGTRSAEAALLALVTEWIRENDQNPSLLTKPLRVVVPSGSLRRHVAARLVEENSGGVVGVRIQTLKALACEVLLPSANQLVNADLLYPILIQRAASKEPALSRVLDPLHEGYRSIAATIDDFLDAGISNDIKKRVENCILAEAPYTVQPRARAILRVALEVRSQLAEIGLQHGSHLFEATRLTLEKNPSALPTRRMIIYGYADATGVQSQLLSTLIQQFDTRILMNVPPNPFGLEQQDPSTNYTARLKERIGGGTISKNPKSGEKRVRPRFISAPSRQVEVEAIATRILKLIQNDVCPEKIGVVTRELQPYTFLIRQTFDHFGIPFSGSQENRGIPTPIRRKFTAITELLQNKGSAPIECWATVTGWSNIHQKLIRNMGLKTIEDLANVELVNFSSLEVKRSLSSLSQAQTKARELVDLLESSDSTKTFTEHCKLLNELLHDDLHYSDQAKSSDVQIIQIHKELAESIPKDVHLSFLEFVSILRGAYDSLGFVPIGGKGFGVQILNVTEARSITFDHLFLIGMNRDTFPRPTSEDGIIPEELRRSLCRVLPDFPIKERCFDEERYLFAQLLSGTSEVTLSWSLRDDGGKERSPSPLIEPLITASKAVKVTSKTHAPLSKDSDVTLYDASWWAVKAGLMGRTQGHRIALRLAIQNARERVGKALDAETIDALLRHRLAMISTLDRAKHVPGATWGFIGPAIDHHDPRFKKIYVTTIENLLVCPWRTFLQNLLKIEKRPEDREELPDISAQVLGNALHLVLERIAEKAGVPIGITLTEAARLEAITISWPEESELKHLLVEVANKCLADAGINLAGMPQVLALRMQSHLERIREIDAPTGFFGPVLASEVKGRTSLLSTQGEKLHFRVDRVDRQGSELLLTDFKSGIRSPTVALQTAAYAMAESEFPCTGRYLYSNPKRDIETAQNLHSSAEDDNSFVEIADVALDLWREGIFFPRLVTETGKEPLPCSYCSVAEACRRGGELPRRNVTEGLKLNAHTIHEGSPTRWQVALNATWKVKT